MIDRRAFLKGSAAASVIAGAGPLVTSARGTESEFVVNSEYYELRRYRVTSQEGAEAVKAFYEEAAIPALNRLGIKPIGVFEKMESGDEPTVYVAAPYFSLDRLVQIPSELAADDKFLEKAENYLERPESKRAFERIESSLMAAFKGWPNLKVPKAAKQNRDRIYELRTYESYSELKGWRKVQMFNEGELEIFLETGLHPVFFGKTLIGDQLPNLTYMLTFSDREERDANWKKFFEHPDWERLKNDPKYADTVSKVHNTFLVPASFSQI